MHCSGCGSESPAGNNFCVHCGNALVGTCAKCGAENSPASNFCGKCGTALNASVSPTTAAATPSVQAPEVIGGERRHLTILFCDLVGSTTLAAQVDPEEWRATVVRYQRAVGEAITGFGGEVERHVGDGIMAFFGYPIAQGNDAERAVHAGLAILDAVTQLDKSPGQTELVVRIGINTGLVVVGAGAGSVQAVDAFGDAANIAARVEGAADPGTVMISDATQRLVAGLFIVEDRGACELKGAAHPIRLYRVIRSSGMRGRFEAMSAARGLTPFVGREDELRSFLSRWERVMDGEGQVVTIIGEAGIGKSRLLQRFHEQIAGTPHTWIEAGAGAFFQNTPFYPISEMLRQMIGDTSASDSLKQLGSRLTAVGLKAAEAIPLLAPLLNLVVPPKYPALALSPEQQRRRLLATLVEWVLGSARSQPLVIATEDLHWIDPSTLELIQLLVEQGASARLLLLYTARPEFRPPWMMRAHHMQLTLGRLNARHVRTMVGQVAAQKALSDETIAEVVERTGGVPLFVEELTRAVLESGNGKLASGEIPATLHDSLMARLDRLGPAKELIQVGAVIGSEFSYELLHAVHPIAEADLQRSLRGLTEAELLYARGIAPETTYQFKHALIRDTAYEALLKSRRKELHLSVARTIDEQFPDIKEAHPEVLARHWTEAGEIKPAIAAWQRAGQRATERGALPEAAGHYIEALDILGQLSDESVRERLELPLQIGLGLALFGAKGFSHQEAHGALTRAQILGERLGEPRLLVEILFGLAGSVFAQGQVIESYKLAKRELDLATQIQDRGFICAAHFQLGQALLMVGRFAEAQAHIDMSIANWDENDARRVATDSRNHARATAVGLALWLGFPDRACRLLREALKTAERDKNHYHLAFVHMWAGFHFLDVRDGQALIAHSQALVKVADEAPFFSGHANFFGGWGALLSGEADKGIARVRLATAFWEAAGYRLQRPWELRAKAEFSAIQGRFDDALALIDQALADGRGELLLYRSPHLTFRADLLFRHGAGADVIETAYREAIDLARDQSARFYQLVATTHFA